MTKKRPKSATLNLRIDPKLKAAAEKMAAEDSRTLTNLVEKLLTDAARAKGLWPPVAARPAKGKKGR